MVNHCVIVRSRPPPARFLFSCCCFFSLPSLLLFLVLRDCVRVVRRGFTQRHTALLMLKRARKMKSKKQQKKKKGESESLDSVEIM